jgi:proteasome accessory factor C
MSKKRTPTLDQTARLLDLVPYISSHQNIPIDELCEKFGVSKKELLDDLNTLWMCGLPGYTPLELIDLSFEEGYVSIRNAEILEVPRSLTHDEIVILILGLDLIEKSAGSLALQISTLKEKLRKIVGDVVRIIPNVDSAHRALLMKAIAERRSIEITYHSHVRDLIDTRIVSPLSVEAHSGAEYLIAMTKSGIRTFRLDRISDLSLGESIQIPATDNAQNESEEIFATILISSSLRSQAEKFNIDFETLRINPGLPSTVNGYSGEWFVRSAMSSAGSVTIVEPSSLRNEIAGRSAELLAAYEGAYLPE